MGMCLQNTTVFILGELQIIHVNKDERGVLLDKALLFGGPAFEIKPVSTQILNSIHCFSQSKYQDHCFEQMKCIISHPFLNASGLGQVISPRTLIKL